MKELFKLKLYIGFYIMSFFMMMTLSWMSKHKNDFKRVICLHSSGSQ